MAKQKVSIVAPLGRLPVNHGSIAVNPAHIHVDGVSGFLNVLTVVVKTTVAAGWY